MDTELESELFRTRQAIRNLSEKLQEKEPQEITLEYPIDKLDLIIAEKIYFSSFDFENITLGKK